jgi:hypothetical protein
MNIAFDFDDVIYDLSTIIQHTIDNKFGPGINIKNRETYFVDNKIKNIGKFLDETIEKENLNGIPLRDSDLWLTNIYKLYQKPIDIITARKEDNGNVKNWLNKYIPNIKYNLIFTNNQSKKPYFLKKFYKYYIEDKSETIEEIHNYVGIVFLMNQTWNKNCKIFDNIKRINNLGEFYNFLIHKRTN